MFQTVYHMLTLSHKFFNRRLSKYLDKSIKISLNESVIIESSWKQCGKSHNVLERRLLQMCQNAPPACGKELAFHFLDATYLPSSFLQNGLLLKYGISKYFPTYGRFCSRRPVKTLWRKQAISPLSRMIFMFCLNVSKSPVATLLYMGKVF